MATTDPDLAEETEGARYLWSAFVPQDEAFFEFEEPDM